MNILIYRIPLYFIFLFNFLFFTSCSTAPELSTMQKRQITTKLYESDYENTYRAILTILQDQGYIIKNTDMNTGLINATINRENNNKKGAIAQSILLGYVVNQGSLIEGSFMVNKINDKKTEVRLNLQESKYGQESKDSEVTMRSSKQVIDSEIYNEIFNQINTEIKRREGIYN